MPHALQYIFFFVRVVYIECYIDPACCHLYYCRCLQFFFVMDFLFQLDRLYFCKQTCYPNYLGRLHFIYAKSRLLVHFCILTFERILVSVVMHVRTSISQ